ncbi:MAG: hypothetical protein OEZ15_11005 [Gammaproteobacteria bacterium]|nr:hypothetical protein [Gammaproteobacteria bacterium]
MNQDDDFESVLTMTLKEGGSASVSFPVPDEIKPFALSLEFTKHAIEYYLLARYSFLHRMHSAYMINSFWAVENSILSILIITIKNKEELKDIGGYHSITTFWDRAKQVVSEDDASLMSNFDAYIGKVKGYFSVRYPVATDDVKLTHTEKTPKVTPGKDANKRGMKFDRVAPLSLDELDHYMSFFLTDLKDDWSGNLMELLASQENMQLYREDNNYSIVYPNRKYLGERNGK